MNVAERVAERLALAPFEETLRERSVREASVVFGCSRAEVYRRVSRGTLACLKVEGAQRRGHGQAGRVSFLLEHLIRWQVEHEETKRPALATPARAETETPDANESSAASCEAQP